MIWLIDDDENIITTYRLVFKRHGHDLLSFDSCFDAFKKGIGSPDFIIIDLSGISGLSQPEFAASAIANLSSRHPGAEIIINSAWHHEITEGTEKEDKDYCPESVVHVVQRGRNCVENLLKIIGKTKL